MNIVSHWHFVLTWQVYLEGQQLEVWRDELLRELKHIQAFKYVTSLSRRGGHGARRERNALQSKLSWYMLYCYVISGTNRCVANTPSDMTASSTSGTCLTLLLTAFSARLGLRRSAGRGAR